MGTRIKSKSSRNHANPRLHNQTNEIENRCKTKHEVYEIETNSTPRRAQGGKGLLSHENLLTRLKNSSLEPYLREGEGEEHRETERRKKGWRLACCSFCPAPTARKRGDATLLPANATYSRCLPFPFPASLHLKTKLPLS